MASSTESPFTGREKVIESERQEAETRERDRDRDRTYLFSYFGSFIILERKLFNGFIHRKPLHKVGYRPHLFLDTHK